MFRTFKPSIRRAYLAIALILGTAAVVPAAYAGSVDGTIASSVTLTSDCQMTVLPLSFGSVDSLATTQKTVNLFQHITCTKGTSVIMSVSAGSTAGTTTTNRAMSDGNGHTLSYQLFQNAGHTINWGNTVGTDTLTLTATGASQQFVVVGVVPPGQGVPPGVYTDTVTVTATY